LIDGYFWLFEREDDQNIYAFDNLLKMTTTLITIPTGKVTIRPPLLISESCMKINEKLR
jgi:hypothetical protein